MVGTAKVWGELGDALPNNDPHGVSVHLPTWKATMGWASRDPAIVDRMKTGYPRFYYNRIVVELTQQVRRLIETAQCSDMGAIAGPAYSAMLFPAIKHAYMLAAYLQEHNAKDNRAKCPECYFFTRGQRTQPPRPELYMPTDWENLDFAVVIFTASTQNLILAKQFWQHTGYGICSRYAEICSKEIQSLVHMRLQGSKASILSNEGQAPSDFDLEILLHSSHPEIDIDMLSEDDGFVQVRLSNASGRAKTPVQPAITHTAGSAGVHKGDGAKKVLLERLAHLNSSPSLSVKAEDVILYPTGMTGITEISDALNPDHDRFKAPIVVFGFLYVDTFKTLERIHRWTTKLFGGASDAEINELEEYLSDGNSVSGLFLEVPGNPLLTSPNLTRLRNLADQYGFPIIIDDTVGTPVNIDVMRFADVVASSLTKMFSGACNVMGGALILNHTKPFYLQLRKALHAQFIDTYFPADAEIMAANSKDFDVRVLSASRNAEMVAYQLMRSAAVEKVFYPKGSHTQGLYDMYRRPEGEYGYLLSINFRVPAAAVAFFDALETAKGPSLGTNFTLCCPYTLYAHYSELDWAAKYGVGEYLVRISVGLEEPHELEKTVEVALRAAEGAMWMSESR